MIIFAKAQEARELIKNCDLNLYVSRDGLSHWVSVKRGPDTCGWRMRMGKCGWKNADNKKIKKEKTRNADGKKINKQTNKRNKSFFQVAVTWLDPPLTYRT